jgi:hypothetical protein
MWTCFFRNKRRRRYDTHNINATVKCTVNSFLYQHPFRPTIYTFFPFFGVVCWWLTFFYCLFKTLSPTTTIYLLPWMTSQALRDFKARPADLFLYTQ